MMPLKQLFSAAFPQEADALPPDWNVSGIQCDSRLVRPGDLFVAVKGAKEDGAAFIREALQRGAKVIVTESDRVPRGVLGNVFYFHVRDTRLVISRLASAFYGHPSQKLKTVGITGTNGKTTSAYLLEHFLSSCGKKTGVLGTISHRYGGKEVPAKETTPGPLVIHRILSEMLEARCEAAVMEVSSHALDQKRTEAIAFGAALFTNLTQDHLDYHGTLKNYFEAKASLFTGLSETSVAVLNADDERGLSLKDRTPAKVLTYGIQKKADLQAGPVFYGKTSTRFEISAGGEKFQAVSPLIGTHNVYNTLGALAVMNGLGFDLKNCVNALPRFGGVPGRLEAVQAGQDFQVFVDFAHTPDGLENVLKSLVPYKSQKLFLVFGCGGDRDKTKRPEMAAIASRFCDRVFVTSDNPRSENPESIIQDICAGFPADFKNFTTVPDRRKALRQALMAARTGDIVLLAGKGHERSQIIGNTVTPFSDREEAEKVLSGR